MEIHSNHPDDGNRDGVGGDSLPAVGEEFEILPLGHIDPARSASDEHASARFVQTKARIGPGLGRGDDRNQ